MDRSTYERILLVASRLAATGDLEAVLREVIDALRDVLGAERASVFQLVRDGEGGADRLFATQAHGLPRDLTIDADRGVIGEAVRSRGVVVVNDAPSHPAFNAEVDRATGFETRQILTLPLIDDAGELVGVAQVLNKRAGGEGFGPHDEAVARHLALQAAVAIRRAVLLERERELARLEADERAARSIQSATLPGGVRERGGGAGEAGCVFRDGWSVHGRWLPADLAAGDAWDVVSCRGGDRQIVMLADATGHGVGAALSVSRVGAMLRMAARTGLGLAETANAINDQLSDELPIGLFVTAAFVELSSGGATARVISAGQAPLVVVRETGETESLGASAPPLGVETWAGGSCLVRSVDLRRGDAFVVASDGVVDSLAPPGRMMEAVAVIAGAVRASSGAGEAADSVLAATGVGRGDDRTIVLIARVADGVEDDGL